MTKIIGVSGDVGSFSEQAALKYSASENIDFSLHYLIDMENVLAALHEIDLGIFPVFNNLGGIVKQAFEAMGRHHFLYLSSLPMNIEQCLLTKNSISFEQIQEVISHPQALAQCAEFIKHHLPSARIISAQDTASSARALSESKYEDNTAIIASAGCADHYKLCLAQRGIQDKNPNITTFIIVKQRQD